MSVDPTNFAMRTTCPGCGYTHGHIIERNGQDTVRCLRCDRHCYNAPKTETGKAPRTLDTIRGALKPQRRARILERDNFTCVLCRANDRVLHVGHLISIEAGLLYGLTDTEINDDENLIAMCEVCNLGYGACPVPLRTAIAIVRARIAWRDRKGAS